ncbi:hypothetical protein M0802_007334 [Mischocyttarus mexicanus]|nr:hypothetical protein M0802_007334 [Mischocyttarus mexicanus]
MGIDVTAGVSTLAVYAYATRSKVIIVLFNHDYDKDNFERSVTKDIIIGSWILCSRYVLELYEKVKKIRYRLGTIALFHSLVFRKDSMPIVILVTRKERCNETRRTSIDHRERQQQQKQQQHQQKGSSSRNEFLG